MGKCIAAMRRGALGCVAASAIGYVLASAAQAEPITLKVMSFNIWYGGEQANFADVVKVIRDADPDIVGVQEPDDNLARLAHETGLVYYDQRRNIISRYPLFDSGVGERTKPGTDGYGIAGLDPDAVHAWAVVGHNKVVAVGNTHLTWEPTYGPDMVAEGNTAEEVVAAENQSRGVEVKPLAELGKLGEAGIPVFVTGDFNSPSHLDWTAEMQAIRPAVKYPVQWPVTVTMESTGFRDSYREAFPDPTKKPGLTWPLVADPVFMEEWAHDRIDYVFTAGPTKTLKSEIIGEVGGKDVDVGVVRYPSDHRAVLSTFSVEPADAKPMISVEPRRVEQGGRFFIRYVLPGAKKFTALVVPRDGTPEQAVTGVNEETTGYRNGIRLSTLGVPAGNYDALLLDGEKVVAKTRFSVVDPDLGAALVIDKPEVAKDAETVTVRWSGAPGNRHDWIGIYEAGDPGMMNYLHYQYVDARLEGEMEVKLTNWGDPLEPGDYELRLMNDDAYVLLAKAAFTIKP